jgi:hypothetical protein
MAIVPKALRGMRLYRRNRRWCSWLRDRIIPSFGVDDLTEIHVCDLVSLDQTKRALPYPRLRATQIEFQCGVHLIIGVPTPL